MVVFIDESGAFSNPQGKPHVVSCVGALIVPETCIDGLFSSFQALKAKWGVKEEIKGSQITEVQASELVSLCLKYDVTLKVIATDIGLTQADAITSHKRDQAQAFRDSAKGAHPNMAKELISLAERIEALPNQLYTQSLFMTLLLDKIFRESTLYYCQRDAHCLGSFVWIIDAKDKSVTEYERLWSTICMPFLQTMSVREPLVQIREGDYSFFSKYHGEKERPPEYLAEYLKSEKQDQAFHYIDIKKLLSCIKFSDSKSDLGLQIADLLTTIVRRSFSLTLQIEGWENIGKLMLQVKKGENVVQFVALGGGPETVKTPYGKIVTHYTQTARPVFK